MDISAVRVSTWKQLSDWYDDPASGSDHWIFRGYADPSWKLESSLERVARHLGIPLTDLPEIEGGLLRRFKRHFEQYELQAPPDGDVIEWLSLMQHYGAPTRLLDFSHSFYVALYFALEDVRSAAEQRVVLAVNQTKLDAKFKEKYPKIDAAYKQMNARDWDEFTSTFLSKHLPKSVMSINPYRLNQRLIIQQGLFLFPLDIATSFEKNAKELLIEDRRPEIIQQLVIRFDRPTYKNALIRLHRMNMNRASLFPGLEGFARSLNTLLAFDKSVLPADIKYRQALARLRS